MFRSTLISFALLAVPAHASAAQSAPMTSTATPSGPGTSAPADRCQGSSNCFDSGTFVAEVVNVTASAMVKGARHHSINFVVRFRNISDKPIVLAYRTASSGGRDEFGNGFTWGRPGTHDTSAKGIGYVDGRSADPQFTLAPGQSRQASFDLIRFNAVPPIGSSFGWNIVIDELEPMPGQQIRSVRQSSISVSNLTPGAHASIAGGSGAAGDLGQAVDAVTKLRDLFKKAH